MRNRIALRKPRKNIDAYFKKNRSISVEDVNGNKHVLKATVIGVSLDAVKKERSQELDADNTSNSIGKDRNIMIPPLSQYELSILREFSSELGPNLDQFVVGVEGFGIRVKERDMQESTKKNFANEINMEKDWIEQHLINFPNPDGNLKCLRQQMLHDREITGNAYLELVPTIKRDGTYTCYNRMEVSTMFITKRDKKFTRITKNYVSSNFVIMKKTFLKKMRRFVQIVAGKKVYFKEFGDIRIIDKRTGDVLDTEKDSAGVIMARDSVGNMIPSKQWANEIYHFKIPHSRRTPYGLPKFTGNIIAIKGSRSAEEANIITQQNNNVPSMAIMVSGGMLTDGSIERLQEFVDQQVKGNLNYSKFLILEGEGTHDGLSNSTSMKIEIKALTSDQHTDALWKDYDEENNKKIRRSFRQPSTLTGNTDKVSREQAQVSESLTEKYVYNPAREGLDDEWNMLMIQQGIRFHVLKTNSPNVTNDQDLVKILATAERSGGLTPRIAHMILTDVFNRDLPPIKENHPDFDPDIPFSISIGILAGGLGKANQEGTMASSGQSEGPKDDDDEEEKSVTDKLFDSIHDSVDPTRQNVPDFLTKLHSAFEDELDLEAFGKKRKNYFKKSTCCG